MKLQSNYFLFFFFILIVSACKTGFENERKSVAPPETFMVVDTLFRTGENRLTTRVEANWWGNSSGGFIVGYELSIDNMQTWTFTKRQDSIILLSIPPGQDSAFNGIT